MERKEFEDLFNRYLDDGFKEFDIVLNNGSIVAFNSKHALYRFFDERCLIVSYRISSEFDYEAVKQISI